MSTLLLAWGNGVTVATPSECDCDVQGPAGRVSLRQISPHVVHALAQIEPAGVEDQRLATFVSDNAEEALSSWYYYVDRLTRRGLLHHSAHENGLRLATLIAVSPSFVSGSRKTLPTKQYVLSRFAYTRRESDQTVLESPRAHSRIVLNDCRTSAVVASLATPVTPQELTEQPHGLSPEGVISVLSLLLRAAMIEECEAEGNTAEDRDASLQTWSFHDMLFHARSRRGRFDAPYGGTYRFANVLPPPPAIKPPSGQAIIPLHKPDLEQLSLNDVPLTAVQEKRTSIREFDSANPITVRQLGEFLYRVARIRNYRMADMSTQPGSITLDFASRPYPSGGGLYEIEFYVAVQRCEGIDAGLYHYAGQDHALEVIRHQSPHITELLGDAATSTSIPADELQVLIILAARVPRLAWKYESIAYALVLKHVGVIYHSMYLNATAMGLAPCAIGGGDADLFARATGADYSAESSVGEFLLGSARSEFTDHAHFGQGERQCGINGNGS